MALTSISKEMEICAGHFLLRHPGACRFAHGHGYKFQVEITGELTRQDRGESATAGMLVDFTYLKEAMKAVIMPWDHAFLAPYSQRQLDTWWQDDATAEAWRVLGFTPESLIGLGRNTTAENMATIVLHRVGTHLKVALGTDEYARAVQHITVRCYETPTSYATASRAGTMVSRKV